MLVVTVRPDESIYIGDQIRVVIVAVPNTSKIRVGIEADPSIPIAREGYLRRLEADRAHGRAG